MHREGESYESTDISKRDEGSVHSNPSALVRITNCVRWMQQCELHDVSRTCTDGFLLEACMKEEQSFVVYFLGSEGDIPTEIHPSLHEVAVQ
jgi:hypothetical protein